MKFKLVESIDDRLVEEVLQEGCLYISAATKKSLLNELAKLSTHQPVPKRLTSNNSSLKRYLCAKYNLSNPDKYAIHHRDLDYNNYHPDNIALVVNHDHSYYHRYCLNYALETLINTKASKRKDKKALLISNFSDEDIARIYNIYSYKMEEWLAQGNNYII